MIDQDLLQKALNQAYFFLKFRMRTEKEIRAFLSKKAEKYHWPTEVVNQALMILKEEKLIDDRQFIKIFVNQRKALKPKGEFVLRNELLRLGIDKQLVDEYFFNHPLDEEELAYKTLLPRLARFNGFPGEKKFQKAVDFLRRRGFSYEVAKKTCAKCFENKLS